eukprot:3492819-Amphidinium_carterae.1
MMVTNCASDAKDELLMQDYGSQQHQTQRGCTHFHDKGIPSRWDVLLVLSRVLQETGTCCGEASSQKAWQTHNDDDDDNNDDDDDDDDDDVDVDDDDDDDDDDDNNDDDDDDDVD